MIENDRARIGGILLAAGGSRRMGTPKLLLTFEGKTLLRRAAEALMATICDPVVVVLGAEVERSRAEIDGLRAAVCLNEKWELGIGSSIRCGLLKLLQVTPDIDAAVITLCDQPHVTSTDIDCLLQAFRESSAEIAAAEYNGIVGVPAVFSDTLFDRLLNLAGDRGARDLIRDTQNTVIVPLPSAAIDIDTPDDLSRLA